jgi:hypothetical protein
VKLHELPAVVRHGVGQGVVAFDAVEAEVERPVSGQEHGHPADLERGHDGEPVMRLDDVPLRDLVRPLIAPFGAVGGGFGFDGFIRADHKAVKVAAEQFIGGNAHFVADDTFLQLLRSPLDQHRLQQVPAFGIGVARERLDGTDLFEIKRRMRIGTDRRRESRARRKSL